MSQTGVLVTGFGGPDSLEAVAPFMANLMGREPSDELVERVRRRYLAIGGSSPLPEIAGSIAFKLAEKLAKEGKPAPVEVGMRYWHPFIDDAMARLKERGCDRVISVSLSPFESKVASEAYREAIAKAAGELGMTFEEAPLLSELPEFVEFLARGTAAAISDLEPNEGAVIAFTAHSLPLEDLVDNDPYVAGLESVADKVATALGLEIGMQGSGDPIFESLRAFGAALPPRPWFLVYQSKGQRPGGWLGPDLDELIEAVAESGAPAIVVCPLGFVTDHMETLYDLDIVAQDRALRSDIEFMRAPVPNDDDDLVTAMAQAIAGSI